MDSGTLPVVPFCNSGNCCFLNVSLRLLLSIPPLLPLSESASPTDLFLLALREAQGAAAGELLLQPGRSLWYCVERFIAGWPGALEQQDAFEFLEFMLRGVEGEVDQRRIHSGKDSLRLRDFIGLRLESLWGDKGSAEVQKRSEDLLVLCLDVKPTLQESLEYLLTPASPLVLSSYISSLRPYLLIAFKRLNRISAAKLTQFVSLPTEFSLAPGLMAPDIPPLSPLHHYSLLGVITHRGKSSESGHYTAIIHTDTGWVHANDERVRPVAWEWVRRQQAYIVLYGLKRRDN